MKQPFILASCVSSLLFSMHTTITQQIRSENKCFELELQREFTMGQMDSSEELVAAYQVHKKNLAENVIITEKQNLISGATKLSYLSWEQEFQKELKKTIRAMIEIGHIHPNIIIHPWDSTDLVQSHISSRADFVNYLMSKGATFKDPKIAPLFGYRAKY